MSVYLIESGLLLAAAPWTKLWDRNYFAARVPAIQAFMLSDSGWTLVELVGVLTMMAGVADLYSTFARRARRSAHPPTASHP